MMMINKNEASSARLVSSHHRILDVHLLTDHDNR
jgi:hypothetical protein